MVLPSATILLEAIEYEKKLKDAEADLNIAKAKLADHLTKFEAVAKAAKETNLAAISVATAAKKLISDLSYSDINDEQLISLRQLDGLILPLPRTVNSLGKACKGLESDSMKFFNLFKEARSNYLKVKSVLADDIAQLKDDEAFVPTDATGKAFYAKHISPAPYVPTLLDRMYAGW